MSPDARPVTGHREDPDSGRVAAARGMFLDLHDEDFPIRIQYGRKQYVVIRTRSGGLVMNAAV